MIDTPWWESTILCGLWAIAGASMGYRFGWLRGALYATRRIKRELGIR